VRLGNHILCKPNANLGAVRISAVVSLHSAAALSFPPLPPPPSDEEYDEANDNAAIYTRVIQATWPSQASSALAASQSSPAAS
jgi:hypothetical protein